MADIRSFFAPPKQKFNKSNFEDKGDAKDEESERFKQSLEIEAENENIEPIRIEETPSICDNESAEIVGTKARPISISENFSSSATKTITPASEKPRSKRVKIIEDYSDSELEVPLPKPSPAKKLVPTNFFHKPPKTMLTGAVI
jgi:hypothetical protein